LNEIGNRRRRAAEAGLVITSDELELSPEDAALGILEVKACLGSLDRTVEVGRCCARLRSDEANGDLLRGDPRRVLARCGRLDRTSGEQGDAHRNDR